MTKPSTEQTNFPKLLTNSILTSSIYQFTFIIFSSTLLLIEMKSFLSLFIQDFCSKILIKYKGGIQFPSKLISGFTWPTLIRRKYKWHSSPCEEKNQFIDENVFGNVYFFIKMWEVVDVLLILGISIGIVIYLLKDFSLLPIMISSLKISFSFICHVIDLHFKKPNVTFHL